MEGSDWESFVEDLREPVASIASAQAEACRIQSLALPRIGFQATQDASCSDSHACGEEHSQPSAAGPATADPASSFMAEADDWVCAICRDVIAAANTAQVKGCEHAYCVTCILRWATFHVAPWCPQCRLPFTKLYTYKTLDGSLSDVMLEESVCLLLRATWYVNAAYAWQAETASQEAHDDDLLDYEEEDEADYYAPTVRIGNRRWGSEGFVRGGRKEARVVPPKAGASSSGGRGKGKEKATGGAVAPPGKGKEKVGEAVGSAAGGKEGMGRRAKRQQKREAADRFGEDKQRGGLRAC